MAGKKEILTPVQVATMLTYIAETKCTVRELHRLLRSDSDSRNAMGLESVPDLTTLTRSFERQGKRWTALGKLAEGVKAA